MKVALGYDGSVTSLDPAKIDTVFQYDLIQNLYGRLLRYNEKNELVADIPKSFSWTESEVRFEFSDKVTTISGHVITAHDAEVSIKRLILKGQSGHGDIRRFLCPKFELKSLYETCPGIHTEKNTLILKVINPDFLPMLLSSLQSADYSILPSSVVEPRDGSIIEKSHRETSGPYFVKTDSPTGHLILRANPRHYLFKSAMVQEIELIPPSEGDVVEGLKSGRIDYLPTSIYFSGPMAEALIKDKANEIYETLPTSLIVLRFSPHGIDGFTPEQRMYAGLLAGNAYVKHFGSIGGKPTEQFFQTFTDGTLDEKDLAFIRNLRNASPAPVFKTPMTFGVPESKFEVLWSAGT